MDDPQGSEGLDFSRRRFLQGAGAMTAGLMLRGTPRLGLSHLALSPRSQDQPAIDVTAAPFGARGDGVTNDRAAFQAAIDAAIQQRKPLWIPRPAAFYRIELDATNRQLNVAGNLAIVGAGRQDTLLRFSIPTPDISDNYAGFYVRNGCQFHIADLRLEEDAHPEGYELQGLFFESGAIDHQCLIEGVDVNGFTNAVITTASSPGTEYGELFLAIRDCDLGHCQNQCVAMWTTERGHKRLHIYDSYIHHTEMSHLVYCHPHNTVHVENTRFDHTTRWAFHLQGSSISGDPEYQRFIGCWFGPNSGRGLITHGGPTTHPRPEVINCLFEASNAIQIRSDVLIDGCYFTNTREAQANSAFVASIENEPWEVTLRNCIFAPKRDVLPYIDLRLDGVTATIANCQFYHQGSGALIALGKGATNASTVSNCLFYVRPDNGSQAVVLELDNGHTTVTDCRFHGRAPGDRGVIMCKNSGGTLGDDAALVLQNCTFQSISNGSLFYVEDGPGNSWAGRITGAANHINDWQSPAPLLALSAPGTGFYARLSPVVAAAPLALSAAPTVVISSNYDAYQLSGGGDIAALHWWSADGAADPLFSGTISLTAASPFALVSGGNIQLAGAARRDVAAGETVRVTYDSAVGQWAVISG
jgi:hypothetical protein